MLNIIKSSMVFALLFFLNASAQDYRWEWQNPKPQGNELLQFQFISPTTGFLRTSGRTLLMTTDAGRTWTEKIITNTSAYYGTANSLFFADSLHGYAVGSGKPPFITKTNDGGQNWQKVSLPGEFSGGYYVNIYGLFFINKLNGFISDNLGYIFHTTDGGDSWSMVKNMDFRDIFEIYFTDSTNGYAIGKSYLYISRDGGKTWKPDSTFAEKITGNKLIYFKDSSHGWVTEKERIYRTMDGGMKWSISKIDSVTRTMDFIVNQIHFIDNKNGWLATNFGLYRTMDGGINWKNIYVSKYGNTYTLPFSGIYFSDNLNGFATGKIKDSDRMGKVLYKTTDGGLSWDSDYQKVVEDLLLGIDFIDKNNGWIAGEGIILHTSNGGANWEVQSNPESRLRAIKFIDQNNGWSVGSSGMVLHTSDGGKNWTKIPVKTSPVSAEAKTDFYTLSFIDANEGWIAGCETYGFGRMFHTSDAGQTWEDITLENIGEIQGVSFLNKNTGWFSRGGTSYNDIGEIYKTDNGGKSWKLQYSALSPCYDLFFVDSLYGWVTCYDAVLRTTDGGESWVKKDSFNSHPHHLFFLDRMHGYMGGQWGSLWYTTDGGVNWNLDNLKMHDNVLGLDFIDTNTGWVIGDLGCILHTDNFTLSAEKYDPVLPKDFKLFQNYPNPFNPSTNIRFRLNQTGHVKVEVYDIVGRKIRTIMDEEKKAGEYTLQFSGEGLSSGIYIYQVIYQGKLHAGKMIILK